MTQRRNITAKLVRFGEGEAMDWEFWRKAGAEGHFSAAWEMVAETDLMRGAGNVSRLQRDVARLVRLNNAESSLTTNIFPGNQ